MSNLIDWLNDKEFNGYFASARWSMLAIGISGVLLLVILFI